MTTSALARLIDHACWAVEPYADWLAIAGSEGPAKSVTMLAHIVAALEHWLARLRGGDEPAELWPTLTAAEARARLAVVRAGFAAWFQAAAPVTVAGAAISVDDAVIEAATHTTCHLGQLDAAYRATGAPRLDRGYLAYRRGVAA